MTCRRLTLAVLLVSCAAPALAQPPSERPTHRFEVSVGGLWLGGTDAGSDDAALRANQTPAAPFTLFDTNTRIEPASGFDGRIGFWLTRTLAVEGGFLYVRPSVRTRVTGDIEGTEALTAEEDVDQYFIDASAVFLLDVLRIGERTIPFVSGGGGYLRQLHEGRTLIETGQVYHVGGGIRHWLRMRDRGFIRGAGVRLDGRAYLLVHGFALDDGPRPHGAISGTFFLTF